MAPEGPWLWVIINASKSHLTEHKVTLSQSVAKQQDAKWPFWCLASMLTISALLYSLDISVEVILWDVLHVLGLEVCSSYKSCQEKLIGS